MDKKTEESDQSKKIEIIKLPLDRWQEYKELRLRALKEDPQAFGSSYDKQKDYSDEEWQARLKDYADGKRNWMLFASDAQKLVGMMGAFQTDEDIKQNSVNVIAVFVPNEERGKGISKLLMSALLDELTTKTPITKAKLSVNKDQIAALRLYESFGFKITGTENIRLGDGELHDEFTMEKELE